MLAEWVKTRMKVTEVHDRPLTQGSVILQATRTRTRQTRQALPNSSPRLLGEPPLPAGSQILVWDVEHWSPPFGSVVRTTKVEALGVNPYLDLDSSQELLRGSYSFPLHPGPPWMNEVAGVLGREGAELFESSYAGLPLSGLPLPPPPPLLLLLLHTLSSKDPHCFGTQSKDSYKRLCLATLLDTKVTNPMEYEFKFQLEIRGPCLLAGKREIPRHRDRQRRPRETGLQAQSHQKDGGGAEHRKTT